MYTAQRIRELFAALNGELERAGVHGGLTKFHSEAADGVAELDGEDYEMTGRGDAFRAEL